MKEMFEDKYDLKMQKMVLEAAQNEGVDISEKNLISISDGETTNYKATDVLDEINKIIEVKNRLFSEINIEDLTDEEYEKLLSEFDDSVKIDLSNTPIKNLKNKYSNINFDNLNERTPSLILTGDVLYETMEKSFGPEWDYSPVIMQWCRAVELELRNKIYTYLDSNAIKEDIANESTNTNYYINGSRRYSNFKKLVVNDMMGFYGAMKKFGMIEYIFNKYIKDNYSNFNINDFKKIIDYVCVVNEYRDNSAHSILQIDLNKSSADNCKEYIVASKKILEILSHLK